MADLAPFSVAAADFALKLHQHADSKTNMVASPLSISLALSMTMAGAEGETKNQMRKALFGDCSHCSNDENVHQEYSKIMSFLNGDHGSIKLHTANRLYASEGSTRELLPAYSGLLEKQYHSKVYPVDFGAAGGEQARSAINGWVGEVTCNKIPDFLPKGVLSADTKLALINAVYFKGDWKFKFNPEKTVQDRPFHVAENKEIMVSMMMQTDSKFGFHENENYRVLALPYAGEELFTFFLLPHDQNGLAQVEQSLTGKELLEAFRTAHTNVVTVLAVGIPKFKLEEDYPLKKVLQQLGCADMFREGEADFSNTNGKRDLYVSAALHKAVIEVNEEGAEAAAATAVIRRARSMPSGPMFIADHPFLFAIVDVKSMNILFTGRFVGTC